MQKALLVLLISCSLHAVYGQKIERAINALKENKLEKAFELFGDLVKKDPEDVAAAIGYAESYLNLIEGGAMAPVHDILDEQILLLGKALEVYPRLSNADKNFISTQLAVYTIEHMRSLRVILSKKTWDTYYANTTSIPEVETFKNKFLFADGLLQKANDLLAELYFTEAKQQNNLTTYNKYLQNYPNTKRKQEVLQLIEALEYKEALASADISRIENWLAKYPASAWRSGAVSEMQKIYAKELELAKAANSLTAMQDYLLKFPNTHLKKEAMRELEKLEYRNAASLRDHTKLERFLTNYPYSTYKDSAQLVLNAIYLSAFREAKKENTLNAFRAYMETFPNSTLKKEAAKEAENIEYKNAVASGSITLLENFLEKYPDATYTQQVANVLSRQYLEAITDRSNREAVIIAAKKIDALPVSPSVMSCMDSCTLYLFRLDSAEVSRSSDVDAYHDLVEQYKGKSFVDLSAIIQKRNHLWREAIVSAPTPDFLSMAEFTKAVADPDDRELVVVLRTGIAYLTKTLQETIQQKMKAALVEKFYTDESDAEPLFALAYTVVQPRITISPSLLYRALVESDQTDAELVLAEVLERLPLEETISMKEVYIKFIDEENNLLEIADYTAIGEIRKRVYEFRDGAFKALPELKANYPMFTAIKSRYGVKKFSPLEIVSRNERGYEVLTYGYTEGNSECCPRYEIKVLFAKNGGQFTPVTALYINAYYDTIDVFPNPEIYTTLGLSLLLNQEEGD